MTLLKTKPKDDAPTAWDADPAVVAHNEKVRDAERALATCERRLREISATLAPFGSTRTERVELKPDDAIPPIDPMKIARGKWEAPPIHGNWAGVAGSHDVAVPTPDPDTWALAKLEAQDVEREVLRGRIALRRAKGERAEAVAAARASRRPEAEQKIRAAVRALADALPAAARANAALVATVEEASRLTGDNYPALSWFVFGDQTLGESFHAEWTRRMTAEGWLEK